MLVYGDHSERTDPNDRLSRISDQLALVRSLPPGLDRHSALVGSLIEGGRLLQGVADADFASAGRDRRSGTTDALSAWLLELAREVWASWRSGFPADLKIVERPAIPVLPAVVELKLPEGFAFYAAYPEAFAEAALELRLNGSPRVIGIRSIGTTLGAMVAAALGAPPPATLRPFGDPFARRVALDSSLEQELLSERHHYVIVDEGPGQSGSSFGAVANWLESRGVPLERIAFVTSHSGSPGPRASRAHRHLWGRVQRVAADLGPRLPQLLGRWASPLLGPLEAPPVEISAGEWRRHLFADERDWPAVNPSWERRKYLVKAGGERWLLKFAGLGHISSRKLELARRLHEAGLGPEPLGLVHGFLAERWHGDGRPLSEGERPLKEVAQYLARRASVGGACAAGASLDQLLEMAERNVTLGMGDAAASALAQWRPRLPALAKRLVPYASDNALAPHEWLRLADGTLLKTDAIDHCEGHDLIGGQDLAWDVAGCAVEFELDRIETAQLAAQTGRIAGRLVDPDLLDFYLIAYAAFGLGRAALAAGMCAHDPAEVHRWNGYLERYRTRLTELLLPSSTGATRRESSIGLDAERIAAGTIRTGSG